MVKIRLKRVGKKNSPFYHIVVADSKKARSGKIIEKIGTYDPLQKPSVVVLDLEKTEEWIKKGAKPTDSAKKMIEIAKGEVKFEKKTKAKYVKEASKAEIVEEEVEAEEAEAETETEETTEEA